MLPPAALEPAIAEAEVQRLVRRSDLKARIAASRGRRGIRTIRALLDADRGPAFTRSAAERKLLGLLRSARLPAPDTNVRLGRHEVDFLWREQRLVVEVDGYRFHGSRLAFERDRRRDAELQAQGLRVIRITWRQLVDEPEAVVARIAAALAIAA